MFFEKRKEQDNLSTVVPVTIPTYYNGIVKDIITKSKSGNCVVTMTLVTKSGNEWFEIYYCSDDERYNPEKIVAKAVDSGEEIVVFDNAIHGYDNMFCNEHSKEQAERRTLKKLNDDLVKIEITVEYSIDYDSEKDDFVNESGLVTLINGNTITWEEAKCNGITWIWVNIIDKSGKKKNIIDAELA